MYKLLNVIANISQCKDTKYSVKFNNFKNKNITCFGLEFNLFATIKTFCGPPVLRNLGFLVFLCACKPYTSKFRYKK